MLDIREENGGMVCVFSGKLDTAACLEVEKALTARARPATGPVVFDLDGVTFVVSMFLRLCIQTCKDVGTPRFSIVNACPAVRKVFALAGLDALITIR